MATLDEIRLGHRKVLQAEEACRIADKDVRDVKGELAELRDELSEFNEKEGFAGSWKETRLTLRISQLKDELAFGRELADEAHAKVLECRAAYAALLRSPLKKGGG